jgi:hypothetical protein
MTECPLTRRRHSGFGAPATYRWDDQSDMMASFKFTSSAGGVRGGGGKNWSFTLPEFNTFAGFHNLIL